MGEMERGRDSLRGLEVNRGERRAKEEQRATGTREAKRASAKLQRKTFRKSATNNNFIAF